VNKAIQLTTSLILALWCCLAQANSNRLDSEADFEIQAQPLSTALVLFSKQAAMQVITASAELGQRQTKGVSGRRTVREALNALLQQSGLEYSLVGENTVAIGGTEMKPAAATTNRQWLRWAQADSAAASGTVLAQSDIASSPPPSSAPEVSRKDDLQEVVVTAQKREERLSEVPISMSVLDGRDLDSSSTVSITETLNLIPGVVATTNLQGNGSYIAIRGVTSSGPIFSGASPVGYYLDSVPLGLVKSAIFPDFDTYDLQRIEVLRGPQGSLYGANAENGLVRVLTNDADLNNYEFKARSTGSYTENGSGNYRADMVANVPIIPGALGARLVVGYESLSGWINNLVEPRINDARLQNYRLKINGQPTDQLSISLSAWRTKDEYGAQSTSDDNYLFAGALPQGVDTTTNAYALKVGYDAPWFTVTSMSSYLRYEDYGNLDLTPLGALEDLLTDFRSRMFSQEVVFNSASKGPWRWTAGAFYRDARDIQYQTLPVLLPAPINYTNGSKSYALYGQLSELFFDNQFEWSLGGRYFKDNVLNQENTSDQGLTNVALYRSAPSFHATTPRAVLSWYPNHDFTGYVSYSEGFRSGFPQDANVIEAAPTLAPMKPDKLHNYEIGAKGNMLDNRLTFDSAVYYISWKDVQQDLLVPVPGGSGVAITALVNGQSASGTGVDFAFTARPVDNFDFGVNFNWNNLSFDRPTYSGGLLLFAKGDRLNYSSRDTAGAFADYGFRFGNGYTSKLSVSTTYSSKQSVHLVAAGAGGANAVFVNLGDNLVNVRATFSVISPNGWTIRAFGDNLNNQNGASPNIATVDAAVSSFVPRVRPRTVGLQLEYQFKQNAR